MPVYSGGQELGDKNTYVVACWLSAHLATGWLWVLKGRVEEVWSIVTGLTDLVNLKSSYAPECLAVVRMEHKLWFYCVFACYDPWLQSNFVVLKSAQSGKLGLYDHTFFFSFQAIKQKAIYNYVLVAMGTLCFSCAVCWLMNHALVGTVFVYCCCHSAGIKQKHRLWSAGSVWQIDTPSRCCCKVSYWNYSNR